MKNIKELRILISMALLLIFILSINANPSPNAENRKLSEVVFYVSWFDVSEPVLDGLKGVELVNSDYQGSTERNIVRYDPALITIEEMENELKEAGIYLGTAK